MQTKKKILISGAGVAGLTLAYWLKRYGFAPTLIEKHPCLRTGGYKIDLRGVALEILKRMEIYSAIVENRTAIHHAICIDKTGKQVTEMNADLCGTRLEGIDLEIMRGNLCLIMKEALGDMECYFGDSITHISESTSGVYVEFEKHKACTFDMVIGADGLHSNVRKLVFGEETDFSQELGVYVSVFSIPNFLNLSACEIEHHSLRRFVNIYKDRNDSQAKVALAFSLAQPFHSRHPNEQKKLIEQVFAHSEWKMPQILAAMQDSANFYFDSMAQIHMPHWSKGRVALVGDAAYSATPLSGQGTSMAIAGAYVLAGELFEARGDYRRAFSRYETLMRPFANKNQALAAMSSCIMKGSSYSIWLYRLAAIMPAKVLHYIKNLALKRTTRAANALSLKDYMDKEVLNNEFYNAYAENFDKIPFEDILMPLMLKYLPKARCNLLEVGSGAGALALWMTQLGHNVTCLEPAEKPAEKARSKGLNVSMTRFQDYAAGQKFDGIVAISSLIHIPRSAIPLQIQKLSQLLKREGLAIVSFIEGDGEGYEDPTGKGKKRFFSKFTQDELIALLSSHFSVIEIHRIEVKKMHQSFLLLVLKPGSQL